MVAIKKTNELIKNSNNQKNEAHLYVQRKSDANKILCLWDKKKEIHWSKYQIKESDMRVKTASFTSPQYLDLTTGQYCLLIVSPMHEDFGGIIIDVEYDSSNGLYNYQCQDFSRAYQSKDVELINDGKVTNYRILQRLVTRGGIPLYGKITKKMKKKWKNELSGLRPCWQYEQNKYVGSISKVNPMTYKNKMIIRNKSYIEAIRDLALGNGAYYDVHFDKYGIVHIEPYHKNDLLKSGLTLTTPEIASTKYKFDTTNIVTGVLVHNSDKTQGGTLYSAEQLIKLDLSVFFGDLYTTIEDQTPKESTSQKTSTDATKTDNPYNTKKKEVEISSDNIDGKSTDKAFLNTLAKELRKNGWKVINHGVGSNMHSEKHLEIKNGVHFCIMGGVDAGMIREVSINSSYVKKQKKLNCRTVWGWKGPNSHCGDIRDGGNRASWMPRAHDDNYSPRSFTGVKNPGKTLVKAKVPFMYAKTAKEMATKFLQGGDVPEAI